MTCDAVAKGKLLSNFQLTADGFSDEAKERFPFYQEIIDQLAYYGSNVLANQWITPAGRHLLCAEILHKFQNVQSVLNYLASNPVSTKQNITDVPTIIICGLTRTGSTLLHNLMACDPNSRAPLLTDMIIQPIPPILRSNIAEHQRRKEDEALYLEKVFENAGCDMEHYLQDRSGSHPTFEYEEDGILQEEVGVRLSFAILAPKHTDLLQWFANDTNKDFSYEYHRLVLQMLHDTDPPKTHWQLKTPMHTLWMDPLLKFYPQASIIMPHRHLDEVIPSTCRLLLAYNRIYFHENDSRSLKKLLERTIEILDLWIEKLIDFRTRHPLGNKVYDLQYEDLMEDPIGTVRRIYDHFDFLKWSDEFEQAMEKWLLKNPQGQQGRNEYAIDQAMLSQLDTTELYKKYEKMFLPPKRIFE